ncbi:MAG: serine phosphatase RsbU (regulator of sigma subunit)/Tfp pilus assembly protein PilF [Crocinitomix sp.]|jgi:serine phosphatase RsbU (regulator of sigma subunit)/Tfp pilus assembly protein PilF
MNSSKLKIILFFAALAFLSTGHASSVVFNVDRPDSLLIALEQVTTDTERASTQLEIGIFYLDRREPNKALAYLENAAEITQDFDDPELESTILCQLGEAYYSTDQGLRAIDCFTAALQYQDELDAEERLGVYNMMGVIYLVFDEGEKGIEYFDQALGLVDEAEVISGDTYEFLYNNKGITFSQMGMLDSAMANHNRCLSIRLQGDGNAGIGQSYNNLGTTFFDSENYDSALFYFEKGLVYRKKVDDPPASSIQESQINISKALIVLGRGLEAKPKLENIEKETELVPNPIIELRLNELLLLLYGDLRDYKNAYKYSIKYYELKDSVFGIEQREELIRINLSSKYAEQKLQDSLINAEQIKLDEIRETKEKEIRDQKAHTSKLVMIGLIVALGLMLGIIILVYWNYRSKKRATEEILEQKNEVEKQRDRVQEEKLIADEQREIAQDQKMELELIHREITDSINYAQRIQNAILPSNESLAKTLPKQFVLYLPKAVVAGDFYWVREEGDYVYFAAADCTGHGVPGALVSIICSNALNRTIEEFHLRDPGEILDKTTDLLIEAFVQSNQDVKDGMDISLCCFNKKTNTYSFAGANNPLYVVKQKTDDVVFWDEVVQNETNYLLELKGDRQSIGWQENRKKFSTQAVIVNAGDMIYSFTDGFPDQFGGERGKKYKYKQLKQFLVSLANEEMDQQLMGLKKEFEQWMGDLEQVDDVCIIGVKV